MFDKKDLSVGMTVYLRVLPGSNLARTWGSNNEIIKAEILEIRKIYIETKPEKILPYNIRFRYDPNRNDIRRFHNDDAEMYLTEQDAKNAVLALETIKNCSKNISQLYTAYGTVITLEDALAISEILKKYEKR